MLKHLLAKLTKRTASSNTCTGFWGYFTAPARSTRCTPGMLHCSPNRRAPKHSCTVITNELQHHQIPHQDGQAGKGRGRRRPGISYSGQHKLLLRVTEALRQPVPSPLHTPHSANLRSIHGLRNTCEPKPQPRIPGARRLPYGMERTLLSNKPEREPKHRLRELKLHKSGEKAFLPLSAPHQEPRASVFSSSR